LQHQNQLDSIENCPLGNESGELILFRCVENPMTSNSFTPKALEKDNSKEIVWRGDFQYLII